MRRTPSGRDRDTLYLSVQAPPDRVTGAAVACSADDEGVPVEDRVADQAQTERGDNTESG